MPQAQNSYQRFPYCLRREFARQYKYNANQIAVQNHLGVSGLAPSQYLKFVSEQCIVVGFSERRRLLLCVSRKYQCGFRCKTSDRLG